MSTTLKCTEIIIAIMDNYLWTANMEKKVLNKITTNWNRKAIASLHIQHFDSASKYDRGQSPAHLPSPWETV